MYVCAQSDMNIRTLDIRYENIASYEKSLIFSDFHTLGAYVTLFLRSWIHPSLLGDSILWVLKYCCCFVFFFNPVFKPLTLYFFALKKHSVIMTIFFSYCWLVTALVQYLLLVWSCNVIVCVCVCVFNRKRSRLWASATIPTLCLIIHRLWSRMSCGWWWSCLVVVSFNSFHYLMLLIFPNVCMGWFFPRNHNVYNLLPLFSLYQNISLLAAFWHL